MAHEILEQNKSGFTELAELLLNKEVIFADDLEKIFGPRKKQEEPAEAAATTEAAAPAETAATAEEATTSELSNNEKAE